MYGARESPDQHNKRRYLYSSSRRRSSEEANQHSDSWRSSEEPNLNSDNQKGFSEESNNHRDRLDKSQGPRLSESDTYPQADRSNSVEAVDQATEINSFVCHGDRPQVTGASNGVSAVAAAVSHSQTFHNNPVELSLSKFRYRVGGDSLTNIYGSQYNNSSSSNSLQKSSRNQRLPPNNHPSSRSNYIKQLNNCEGPYFDSLHPSPAYSKYYNSKTSLCNEATSGAWYEHLPPGTPQQREKFNSRAQETRSSQSEERTVYTNKLVMDVANANQVSI